MSKDKISDYSATANSNTDIGGINIDEGCAPSGINDAIRTLMKQLKDWQSGSQDVYIHPAGSASVPSITATGDTNTGLFFPAADTIALTTGGSERLRLDSSGNLGLGVTPSAWTSSFRALDMYGTGSVASASDNMNITNNAYFNGTNYIYKANGAANRYAQSGGIHYWFTGASGTAGNAITFTQAMTLDASGNLGLGGTPVSVGVAGMPAYSALSTTSGRSGAFYWQDTGANNVAYSYFYGSIFNFGTATAHPIAFVTNGSERARITSSGYFKASNNGTYANSTGAFHELWTNANTPAAVITNAITSGFTDSVVNLSLGYAANTTSSQFLQAYDTSATRFYVRTNGGIGNYQANNVNLSDRREKTNFAPAGDYLTKICAIPVQTFNYIDQNLEEDGGLTLGVVAQDVQAVAPELVTESNWAKEGDEPKMRLSIYQTDLQYALMKALQELKAEFDAYKATHP